MVFERMRVWAPHREDEKLKKFFEHLDPPFEPITTSITEGYKVGNHMEVTDLFDSSRIEGVNYYADPGAIQERGQLSAGKQTYVLSAISPAPKISDQYCNCQGLVVGGVSHEGEELSFLTHHDPKKIMQAEVWKEFEADLRGRLRELKLKTKLGSIDAVSFGGDMYTQTKSLTFDGLDRRDDYVITAQAVAEIVEEELGFEPRVVEGPRYVPSEPGERNKQLAMYDTKKRHLIIKIDGAGSNSGKGPFYPSQLSDPDFDIMNP